jgi:DNA-directed RNA polymerase subunit L
MSTSIYKTNQRLQIKNEDLPFTNVLRRIKHPSVEPRVTEKTQDVLQKTYYNIAHPPNKNPLSQLKT